jgi:hypothetical protein
MNDFASMVDRFVSTYKHDERKFVQDMCNDIVKFLTNSLFARSNNFVLIRIQSQPSSLTKSVSFAAVAKTLRNSGADFYAKQPQSTTLPQSPGVSRSPPPPLAPLIAVSEAPWPRRRISVSLSQSSLQPCSIGQSPSPYAKSLLPRS